MHQHNRLGEESGTELILLKFFGLNWYVADNLSGTGMKEGTVNL